MGLSFFKNRNLLYLIGGILFISGGIHTYSMEGEFLIIRGSPVLRVLQSALEIFLGCYLLSKLFFFKAKSEDEAFVMCIKCKHSFYRKYATDNLCPNCGGRVEDMDGIFERHPELKK